MKKYISINIPNQSECGYCWWVPEHGPKIINFIEKNNPKYEFIQFVTREGNGGYPSYVLLKRKK